MTRTDDMTPELGPQPNNQQRISDPNRRRPMYRPKQHQSQENRDPFGILADQQQQQNQQ